MENKKIDIAIVGGGVSGVYSAWKLKTKYPDKKIVLFEGGDHIGGRLLSVIPPGIPNMVAELGGMRILENTQHLIVKLIEDINKKLSPEEQIKLYDFPVDQPQNIAYLRGEHLRLSDFTSDPDKVPYKLSFLEKGNTSGTIIVNAIEQLVPGVTNTNLTEKERLDMCHKATFEGEPLYTLGFWNLLYRVISGEAYQFSIDSGGYNSTLVNWNAADAIPWYLSDFGLVPKYKGFKNGFQQVPISLANFFEQDGGEVRLNAKLEGFESKNNIFELTINGEIIEATQLILAMPRRSLDLLTNTSPRLQEIQSLISSVTPRPLFKVFTTYSSPWWRNAGYTDPVEGYVPLQSGRTVTDLPIRQTYYWPINNGDPSQSGESMLLASYDDGSNIGFWDGLRPQRKKAWKKGISHADLISDPFIGEGANAEIAESKVLNQSWHDYQAPRKMVEELDRQLKQIHDVDYTPAVQSASFRDWGEDPFGGGWNSWNIGVKSWEVKEQIVHPIENCSLYICGEAYSDAQGWVEGALQTADIMLTKFIAIESKNPVKQEAIS
ncbi:FAD-dependent oxidoreductase [Flavobacterium sp. LS1R49]|uniref:FAD-dependent oxidoreductase n=1 Tax=Flavobacterium shii TaxID=2987687 RepID=A0A9X3BZ67_9FLAO|nr:FAD-dependent oxidoreductase [Flavobacterium shii]MCV9929815.1 FAD-dependent oxidoreductase [Flavobacterium shii]